MGLVEKQIASVKSTTDRFDFQVPVLYYEHKWEIHRFSDQLKNLENQTVNELKPLQENFCVDKQTKLCIELDQDKEPGEKYLTLHLRLVECSLDRMTLWHRISILDKKGNKCKSMSMCIDCEDLTM